MDDAAMDVAVATWSERQPIVERSDPLWSLMAYRIARFAQALALEDLRGVRTISSATRDQLLRAVTSISANIAEGYSRPSARERTRYYTYSLGSAREAVSWYASISDCLADGVAESRVEVLVRIRRLLIGLIYRSRQTGWRSNPRPGNGASGAEQRGSGE